MAKPPPGRVQAAWDLLRGPPSDEETAAEVARIAKLAPDELDRALEGGGFDLRQVEANAERLRRRLLHPAPEAPAIDPGPPTTSEPTRRTAAAVDAVPPRIRPRRLRNEYLSGLALAAAVIALGIGFTLRTRAGRETPIARPDVPSLPSPSETSSSTPSLEATTLRMGATAACNDRSWKECRDLLDRAARLDPAGDAAP
ncbi:MAG TPA: hypothetical protein VK841_12825, partial [Polyangiaceae bacterium]|nr:hypothetical protein [Polyangiaceae bacterium]